MALHRRDRLRVQMVQQMVGDGDQRSPESGPLANALATLPWRAGHTKKCTSPTPAASASVRQALRTFSGGSSCKPSASRLAPWQSENPNPRWGRSQGISMERTAHAYAARGRAMPAPATIPRTTKRGGVTVSCRMWIRAGAAIATRMAVAAIKTTSAPDYHQSPKRGCRWDGGHGLTEREAEQDGARQVRPSPIAVLLPETPIPDRPVPLPRSRAGRLGPTPGWARAATGRPSG
jgi:hypothetical protein